MKEFVFSIESELNTNREFLWKHITQMKNVNAELIPFASMTYPKELPDLDATDIPLRTTLFRSLILLFGIIPIDLHYLRLEEIKAGEFFRENSVSLMHHSWKHYRCLAEKSGKILLRDEVSFSPRVPLQGYALLPVYKMVFRNRHENLKKLFQKN